MVTVAGVESSNWFQLEKSAVLLSCQGKLSQIDICFAS
jgi:hypothetical protein